MDVVCGLPNVRVAGDWNLVSLVKTCPICIYRDVEGDRALMAETPSKWILPVLVFGAWSSREKIVVAGQLPAAG